MTDGSQLHQRSENRRPGSRRLASRSWCGSEHHSFEHRRSKAISLVIPELKGKLNGGAMRVPTPTVSIVDLVVNTDKTVTVEAANAAFQAAADGRMKGILGVSNEPLVSVDYKGDPRSSIVDALSTMTMGDNLLKVMSWYDNEWGYSCRVADLINYMVSKGLTD
jgi:glyceraldehyde 3-phosphate dehydrogenase